MLTSRSAWSTGKGGTECEDIFARNGSATHVRGLETTFDSRIDMERVSHGSATPCTTPHHVYCATRSVFRSPCPCYPLLSTKNLLLSTSFIATIVPTLPIIISRRLSLIAFVSCNIISQSFRHYLGNFLFTYLISWLCLLKIPTRTR